MTARVWWTGLGLVGVLALAGSSRVRADEIAPHAIPVAELTTPRAPTPGAPPANPIELHVLTDAEGGTYVVVFGDETRVFYGTGKKLYEQRVKSKSGALAEGLWDVSTYAPRLDGQRPASISKTRDLGMVKFCSQDAPVPLTELLGAQVTAQLAKVKLFSSAMIHVAYRLARDDRGVYYYLDRLSSVYGDDGFRLFVGKRGAMRNVPLTDVAQDTAGEVFNTKTGDLRLVRSVEAGAQTLEWVRGSKRTKLVDVDVNDNSPLIYADLGVYTFIGTLCDNPTPAKHNRH